MNAIVNDTLFRCAWGNQRLILGPQAAVSRLGGKAIYGQGEDASHMLRSLVLRAGTSQPLRQCCLAWRLHTLALWQMSDTEFAEWLSRQVQLGSLTIAVLPDHGIVAGHFEGVENTRSAVLKSLRAAKDADPALQGGRKLLAAIAPSAGGGTAKPAAAPMPPGAAPAAAAVPDMGAERVSRMSLEDRLVEVLHRTADGDLLSEEAKQQLEAALSPEAIATTVAVLAIWAGSHAVGIGFFVDLLMVVVGLYSVGTAAIEGLNKLIEFLSLTRNARNSDDLDNAAKLLAAAITLLGVTVLLRLISRGASGVRGAAKPKGISKNEGSKTKNVADKDKIEERTKGGGDTPPPKQQPSGGGKDGIPHGFSSADEFAQFGKNLQAGLNKAGYDDAQAIVQGSAVTGKSFKTGEPFDVGRVSDFDVALSGKSLMEAARKAGIPLRSGGTRTGPLSERDLRRMGLFDTAAQLSNQAGRPVNFMIFEAAEAAAKRAPSILIPK